ncbi:MAG: hypothetical protein H7333_04290 [Bdellovibrionales bacterium]|nr:hypothetical protein [Oligoflexia bacterium]
MLIWFEKLIAGKKSFRNSESRKEWMTKPLAISLGQLGMRKGIIRKSEKRSEWMNQSDGSEHPFLPKRMEQKPAREKRAQTEILYGC